LAPSHQGVAERDENAAHVCGSALELRELDAPIANLLRGLVDVIGTDARDPARGELVLRARHRTEGVFRATVRVAGF
jgi:hypothetical protein